MNEEQQKKYIEYQILNNQIKQISNQIGLLDQQLVELNGMEIGLIDLEKNKVGSSLLVPVGSGVFVEGELKDNKNVFMNVGAGVVVKKNFNETKSMLDKQMQETANVMQQLEMELINLSSRVKEIQGELSKK